MTLTCPPLPKQLVLGLKRGNGRWHLGSHPGATQVVEQSSYRNNEKQDKNPVSMQMWSPQRLSERQLNWQLILNCLSLSFCVISLSRTGARVVERTLLIYSAKSYVSWNKQKHVKYLMLLLDADPKRCLFNHRDHGLSQTFCIHEDSECAWC